MNTRAHVPLWPHQRDAVAAAVRTLKTVPRTTVVAACGSGKTRVGAHVAADLVPEHGRVLFTAPSVELLAQTLREHAAGPREAGLLIAVCSGGAALARLHGDPDLREAEITTDPALLAALLKAPGPATVACTYQSLDVLREAHAHHGLPPWPLVIVDEAHRTAGARGKPWAAIHDDAVVPARRRLYMTATPRLLAEGGEEPAASMDDEALFGPVCFRLPFAEAIERGLLADYRVVVPVITHADILRIVAAQDTARQLDAGMGAVDPALLAVQVALLRSAAQYGIRRVITYHNRVAEAAAFARSMHAAAALLRPHERPERLTALHGESKQSAHEQRAALQALGSHEPGLVVVANAGMLAEGVDVPAVDAVAFLAARDSPEAVTQAVGRALRTAGQPDKIATIVIPVPLGTDHTPESALETSAYAPVWRTVRALRAHDERLAERVDAVRFARGRAAYQPRPPRLALPQWLQIAGVAVPEGFADAIALRMVRESTPAWEEMYGRAVAHRERHGHLSPERKNERELCDWLIRQRKRYRDGVLMPQRAARLEQIGIAWTPSDEQWARGLAVVRSFHQAHGHLNAPQPLVWGDPPFALGVWLSTARQNRKKGVLSAARIADLDALGMDWTPAQSAWTRSLQIARAYHAEHGHLTPPNQLEWGDPPIALGRWVSRQRSARDAGKLTAQQIAQLDELCIAWNGPSDKHWAARIRELRAYLREHDGAAPTEEHAAGLTHWLTSQRKHDRAGTLAPERSAQLQQILGSGWTGTPAADDAWTIRFEQFRAFLDEHDGAKPTEEANQDLYRWLGGQKNRHRNRGGLRPEREAALAELLGAGWADGTAASAEEAWSQQLEQLREHLAAHNGAPPNTTTDPDLAKWLARQQRHQAERGGLRPERAALLEEVLGPDWARRPTKEQTWTARLEELRTHLREHDGALPTEEHGRELLTWLRGQRNRHHNRGGLRPEREAALAELLGKQWAGEPKSDAEERWNRRLEQLREHLAAHDGALPTVHTNEGLRRWLTAQCRDHVRARLDARHATALGQLLGPDWVEAADTGRLGVVPVLEQGAAA